MKLFNFLILIFLLFFFGFFLIPDQVEADTNELKVFFFKNTPICIVGDACIVDYGCINSTNKCCTIENGINITEANMRAENSDWDQLPLLEKQKKIQYKCCISVRDKDDNVIKAFQKNDNVKGLKPSDNNDCSNISGDNKIFLNPGLTYSEIYGNYPEDDTDDIGLRDEVKKFVTQVKDWTNETLNLEPDFVEIEILETSEKVELSRLWDGLWMSPDNAGSLINPYITKDTDFVIVTQNIYDSSRNLFFPLPACGLNFGADNGVGGASYSWIPKSFVHGHSVWFECANSGTYMHEWLNAMDYAVDQVTGVPDQYKNNYPDYCYNPNSTNCSASQTRLWFPCASAHSTKDPCFEACGQNWNNYCASVDDCNSVWHRFILEKHYVPTYEYSLDPNSSSYLGHSLIGNHCRNGIKDCGETDIDCGGSHCSVCSSVKSITVTSPNGGEIWIHGHTYDITWTATGVANVTISLQGINTKTIATSVSASLGEYSWTVPIDISLSSGYKILIKDTNSLMNDQSDNFFTIIPPICLDSDSGKNYYLKGTVTDSTGKSYPDICSSDTLIEYYCGTDNIYRNEFFTCPYGCNNGACKEGITINLSLEAKPVGGNHLINKVSIFKSGQTTVIWSKTNSTTDNNDLILDLSNFTYNRSDLYNIKTEIDNYLDKKVTHNLVDNITTAVQMKIGDLDNNNIISSSDWTAMADNWQTGDSDADFNEDGIVNTIDFSFMNRNWGASGD